MISDYSLIDISELADEDLGEDDVFVLESIAEAKKNDEDKLRVTLILTMKESMAALGKVVKIIEVRISEYLKYSRVQNSIENW